MGILQMASGKKWESGLEAELRKLQKRELRKMKQAKKERSNGLLLRVEEKIPHKVLSGLKKAFRKVFFLVFSKGAGVIEKTFDKDALQKDYAVRNYAVDLKGGKKEIRQFGKDIKIQLLRSGFFRELYRRSVLHIGVIVWKLRLYRKIFSVRGCIQPRTYFAASRPESGAF